MVRRFHFPLLLFIGFIHISAVLAEEAGSPPHTRIQGPAINSTVNSSEACGDGFATLCKRKRRSSEKILCGIKGQKSVYDKFCYYWMEIGLYTNAFNLAGWNGNENEKASAYIKGNIKETCSHLTSTGPTTNTSGITYLLSSSSEQRGHLTDVLFYCCKVCTQMGNYELLPFMRNLYLQHYQMLARLGKRPNKALAAHDTKRNQHCRNGLGFRLHNWESHACISWVELHGTHVRYYAGPMLINNMQQWEMKLDNKEIRMEKGPPMPSAVTSFGSQTRLCNVFHDGVPDLMFSDEKITFIPDLHCLVQMSGIYSRFCCCIPIQHECSLPTSTHVLASETLCAIGKIGMDVRDTELVTTSGNSFARKTKFCSARYTYSLLTDAINVSVEMDTAEGCTYGEENGGSRHCVKRRTSCPSYDNDIDAEEEVVVHCCCNGSHLCNHDTLSYHAISMIPIEAKIERCSRRSIYQKVFMPYIFSIAEEEDELVCSVHYDLAKKKVVYLLPYDNLIVSDANFRKFYSDPSFCGFILARISPAVLSACPDDVYTVEDTIIDRFIFMCTCVTWRELYGPDPCDWKLSEDIAVLLVAYIGFLPKCKCYNAESHGTKLFNESALLDDSHLEPQRVNETAWCYDEMHWHDERHWKYRSGEVTASVPEVLAICGELSLVGTKYRCVQLEDGYVCCCRSEGENACNGAKRFYAQFDETSMGSTTTPPDWEDELIFREEILHPNY